MDRIEYTSEGLCTGCAGEHLYHIWGCKEFDWKGLSEAMELIYTEYYAATGNRAHMKEKYSTVRLEFTFLWLKTNLEVQIFNDIIRRVADKYLHISEYILNDWKVIYNEQE